MRVQVRLAPPGGPSRDAVYDFPEVPGIGHTVHTPDGWGIVRYVDLWVAADEDGDPIDAPQYMIVCKDGAFYDKTEAPG